MFSGALQPMHVLIVVVIVLLLFGAKRLPELGRSMGTGIREFKKGVSELHADVSDEQPGGAAAGPTAPVKVESVASQSEAE